MRGGRTITPAVEEICTITAKGQMTVPKSIRRALGVGYGSRIVFRIQDGAVTVHAAGEPEADPPLAPFLALLQRDIQARPEVLAALTPNLAARMAAAVMGVNVDHEAPFEGYVAL